MAAVHLNLLIRLQALTVIFRSILVLHDQEAIVGVEYSSAEKGDGVAEEEGGFSCQCKHALAGVWEPSS